MKDIKFYLEYDGYNEENFQVADNYYSDSNDYIKKLEESYNQTKDTIFEIMSKGDLKVDSGTYKMNMSTLSPRVKKVSYTTCKGEIFDDNGSLMQEKFIYQYDLNKDIAVLKIVFEINSMEEEFETAWQMYVNETKKISAYSTDEDWKFIHKPKRDIFLSYLNDKNEVIYVRLNNCRIESIMNTYSCILIVENIEIIQKLP